MKPLHHFSAVELRDAFIRGEVTATAITHHFLKRINRHNQKLGAFLTTFEARALLKAEAIDKKRAHNQPLGKMAAIPVAIKDNMHIQGETTTCGSKFLSNYKAPFHSTAVHLLEQEDALILGKTNLDEFAMGSSTENSAFGTTKNPHDHTRVPGGSSGGSAAAVVADLAVFALGSDTGGSIRQPASFSGIVSEASTAATGSRELWWVEQTSQS